MKYNDATKEAAAIHIWSKLKSIDWKIDDLQYEIDIKKWYPIIKPEMNQSILDGKLKEKKMLQYIASLIEKDNNLSEFLVNKYKTNKIVKIINIDILKFKLQNLNKKNQIILGNLPYNISSQILIKILKKNLQM